MTAFSSSKATRDQQNGPPFIGKVKGIPADRAALQPISSQPSASQASGFSSVESSPRDGGTDDKLEHRRPSVMQSTSVAARVPSESATRRAEECHPPKELRRKHA